VLAVLDSAYTRIPLYEGETDNIVGIVHTREVLRAVLEAKGDVQRIDVRQFMRKPWFIPESRPVQMQLNAFLKRHSHMALAVDEYGALRGLVTLEDIIEEIVGDIADEHDEPSDETSPGIQKQADGSYLIDASLPIRDVNRSLGWNLPDDKASTIAGIVIHANKVIPVPGQEMIAHGFRFLVLERDKQRISMVRVQAIEDADTVLPPE